jgi:DNA-binding NarL/FixJ family response regulator
VIDVLVVDDQAMVRDGFAAILGAEDDVRVVGVSADGVEAVEAAVRLAPDVVVMDVRMPRMDGIDATRQVVARTGAKVLILTTFDLDEYVFRAVTNGASGFLLKDAPRGRLAEAIRQVHRGDMLVDQAVTRRLVERFARARTSGESRLESLTARERDVLRELARGRSNAEIAEALFVGDATVKTHVTSILRKLGVRDRVQAVVLAYESGLVVPGTDPA